MPGLGRFVRALPDRIDRALMRVEKGTLHIEFDRDVPHHIISEFNLMSKRISASLIVAAFIVSGALITHSRVGPHVYNIPLVGSTAFTIAGGIIVFIIGYHILQGTGSKTHTPSDEDIRTSLESKLSIAVSPLAVPLLAGPGTIATAMSFASYGGPDYTLVSLSMFG